MVYLVNRRIAVFVQAGLDHPPKYAEEPRALFTLTIIARPQNLGRKRTCGGTEVRQLPNLCAAHNPWVLAKNPGVLFDLAAILVHPLCGSV
jgi:hypothetical protein